MFKYVFCFLLALPVVLQGTETSHSLADTTVLTEVVARAPTYLDSL